MAIQELMQPFFMVFPRFPYIGKMKSWIGKPTKSVLNGAKKKESIQYKISRTESSHIKNMRSFGMKDVPKCIRSLKLDGNLKTEKPDHSWKPLSNSTFLVKK